MNAWKNYNETDIKALEGLCSEYMDFLSAGKTERECTTLIREIAEEAGYKNLDDTDMLKPGDRVYSVNMDKSIVLFNIGEDIVRDGLNIVGSHIDSPRLDIKQNPLYETEEMAYLNTHYYGGIKKYQWVTMPLALHGVVCKTDGSKIDIAIGEKEDEPVFFVSDLLIHLAAKQMEKAAVTVIEGENLDILVGSRPLEGEDKEAVKKFLLDYLDKEYGIEEDDFVSAEIEAVPAGRAREAGFDRSMILSYGQDDRSCSFASLKAVLDVDKPEVTSCAIFVDKEEIGSVGATGMLSRFFENAVLEVLERMRLDNGLNLARVLRGSRMLSADVNAAYDSLYAPAFELSNASVLGHGATVVKFKGARGKAGTNDANAEFLASLRDIWDRNGVVHQHTEGGKVDMGGGGTIAYMLANYGMQVVDCCVPILNMHAPWEAISKADLYEVFKAYRIFFKEAK
ncbi:MAG: aminopeptidase [Firmicutes bacterium]|nr:aminopeptidase [Bacillota bacterium]